MCSIYIQPTVTVHYTHLKAFVMRKKVASKLLVLALLVTTSTVCLYYKNFTATVNQVGLTKKESHRESTVQTCYLYSLRTITEKRRWTLGT